MEEEYKTTLIKLEQLQQHPRNPRLFMHEETIEGVIATINEQKKLPEAHRVQTRI